MSPCRWVWTWRVLRWALAGVFVAAAVLKIMAPAQFVVDIFNYQLLPLWALHAMAIYLPWLEVICGVALLVGRWTEEASAILGAMLVVYVVAIASTMVRGISLDCGCFGKYDTGSATVVLIRDVVFLLMAVGIVVANRRRRVSADVEPVAGDVEGAVG